MRYSKKALMYIEAITHLKIEFNSKLNYIWIAAMSESYALSHKLAWVYGNGESWFNRPQYFFLCCWWNWAFTICACHLNIRFSSYVWPSPWHTCTHTHIVRYNNYINAVSFYYKTIQLNAHSSYDTIHTETANKHIN